MQELDKKDKRLLKELNFNAKESISGLSKKIMVSKEVANYRLRRLTEQGIIKGFVAVIDSYTLGYKIYRIVIKFKGISEQTKQEITKWILRHPDTAWVVELAGRWDMAFLFWEKNIFRFNKLYENFLKNYGQYIQDKKISIVTQIEHRPYNFLYDKPVEKSFKVGSYNSLIIDKTDEKLLDILSENCRTPLVDIAKQLKMTANAVKYRIRNLEDKKIIKGYRVIINNNKFALSHYKIFLYLSDPSKKEELKSFLRQIPTVIYITDSLSDVDLEFEMLCDNPKELYDTVKEINKLQKGLVKNFEEILTIEEKAIDYFPETDPTSA